MRIVSGLILLILKCIPQISAASGTSFTDDFQFLDTSRWNHLEGSLHCSGQICAVASHENIVFQKRSNFDPQMRHISFIPALAHLVSESNEMEMRLRNNCFGCCKERRCANFTTGIISSKEAYGFGKYSFVGRPALSKINSKSISSFHAISCFGLKGHKEGNMLEVSFCFESEDARHVYLKMINGGHRWVQKITLMFNTATETGIYSLDWQKDSVTFIVNHIVQKTLISTFVVPEPLHIKLLLLPSFTSQGLAFRRDQTSMSMQIFSVQYRKYSIPGPGWLQNDKGSLKEEPLVFGNATTRLEAKLGIITLMLFMFAVFLVCNNCGSQYQSCDAHESFPPETGAGYVRFLEQ